MEKRHTYLGWPLPRTESQRSAVKIRLIHWGEHLYSNLFSRWYFSKQWPITISRVTRPVNPNRVKEENRLTWSAVSHPHNIWCIGLSQIHFFIHSSTLNLAPSPAQSLNNKTTHAGCLGWRSVKNLILIPSHAQILEIHLHSSATLAPEGGICGNMSDCLVKITIQLGQFIYWKAC